MRILGIDYGTRRIGLAISDPLGITAQPLETYARSGSLNKDIDYLVRLADEYGVDQIVIGLPKNMDGSKGALWEESDGFRQRLEKETGIAVDGWDERLSTAEAERMLISADISRKRRRKVVDKIAASLILRSYMESAAMRSKGPQETV